MTARPQGHDASLLRDAAEAVTNRFLGKVDGLEPDTLVRAVATYLRSLADASEAEQRRETSERWSAYRNAVSLDARLGTVIRQVRVRGFVGLERVYSAVEVPRDDYCEAVRQEALARFREKYPHAMGTRAVLMDYVDNPKESKA